MAFTRSSFAFTKEGSRDDKLFDEWITTEQRALKISLAGDENLNSGAKGKAILDQKFTILKWALRDTMVRGYISGFEDKIDVHPAIPQMFETTRMKLHS